MPKSNYTYTGTKVFINNAMDGVVLDNLSPNIYTLSFDMENGFYLTVRDNYTLPEKIYGKAPDLIDRILNTYNDRRKNTGVLLSGDKGNGKSLLCKMLCQKAIANGVPVIVIDNQYSGQLFKDFLLRIGQQCVIFIDEFEKIYDVDQEHQNDFLSLMDGNSESNLLFLLTCNSLYRISEYMRDRPGRVYYSLDFSNVDNSAAEEYVDDNLNNKNNKEALLTFIKLSYSVNFDTLAAIVEEMNRYDMGISDVYDVLNIGEDSASITFNIEKIDGLKPGEVLGREFLEFSPSHEQTITIYVNNLADHTPTSTKTDQIQNAGKFSDIPENVDEIFFADDEDNKRNAYIKFYVDDIISINHNPLTIVIKSRDGNYVATLKESVLPSHSSIFDKLAS